MKKCISCATENADHAKFCKKCGTMFISNYTQSDIIVDKKKKTKKLNPVISAVIWIFLAFFSVAGMLFTLKFFLLPQLQEFLKQIIQLEYKMNYVYEGISLSYVFSALRYVFGYGAFAGLFALSGVTFVFSFFGIAVNIIKASAAKKDDGKKPVVLSKIYSVFFKIYIAVIILITILTGLMALFSILL